MHSSFNDPLRQLSLKYDFKAYETPAVLHELTPDFLRELFDQVVHYGFPDAPLSPNRVLFLCVNDKPIRITASLDQNVLMLCVGSSQNGTFYLITPSGLIFWEKGLRSSDIMQASEKFDRAMEQRGFFNRDLNTRIDLLDAKSFRISEVFVKPFLTYVLPIDQKQDFSELFDEPQQVVVLRLHGRDVACKRDEADGVRKYYKPLSRKDVSDNLKDHLRRLRSQADPRRYS